jgi:DNA-binding MarR family transcriptional regulator
MALSLLRRQGGELTARQLGIFLTVYLGRRPAHGPGLATLFHICKPAVARSLDRLGELGLVRRNVDPRDRRSVLVHRTELGWAFLAELRRAVGRAADDAERGAEAAARRFAAAGGAGRGPDFARAPPARLNRLPGRVQSGGAPSSAIQSGKVAAATTCSVVVSAAISGASPPSARAMT